MGDLELKIFPYKMYESGLKDQNSILNKGKANIIELSSSIPPGTFAEVVSSAHGTIRTLVFHYPDINDDDVIYQQNFIEQLIRKMPRVDNFIIITDKESSEATLSDFGALARVINTNHNATIHVCNVIPSIKKGFSHWASDPYKAITYYSYENQRKEFYLVEPKNLIKGQLYGVLRTMMRGSSDYKDLQYLFRESNFQKAPFRFDGGNILVGDDFILIGKDTEIYHPKKSDVKKWLGGNKEVYFIGGVPPKEYKAEYKSSDGVTNKIFGLIGTQQPFFHLDLFITLAGYNFSGEYQLVIGQPVIGIDEAKMQELEPDVLAIILEQVYKMEVSINQVIKQLNNIYNNEGKHKFKIVRIPMPLTYHDIVSDSERLRMWYWVSYNNCLVEISENFKTVWLPLYTDDYSSFSFPKEELHKWETAIKNASNANIDAINYGNWRDDLEEYERQALSIWEDELGFNQVIPIQADFHRYMQKRGALACLVNCIERKD